MSEIHEFCVPSNSPDNAMSLSPLQSTVDQPSPYGRRPEDRGGRLLGPQNAMEKSKPCKAEATNIRYSIQILDPHERIQWSYWTHMLHCIFVCATIELEGLHCIVLFFAWELHWIIIVVLSNFSCVDSVFVLNMFVLNGIICWIEKQAL